MVLRFPISSIVLRPIIIIALVWIYVSGLSIINHDCRFPGATSQSSSIPALISVVQTPAIPRLKIRYHRSLLQMYSLEFQYLVYIRICSNVTSLRRTTTTRNLLLTLSC
jgi:hypothetical protein